MYLASLYSPDFLEDIVNGRVPLQIPWRITFLALPARCHYNKHTAKKKRQKAYLPGEYRDAKYIDRCTSVYYCTVIEGFTRCILEDDFKMLLASDPNKAFATDRECPTFD
jgi:hypothetical protein